MVFNSITFFIFFSVFFLLYWFAFKNNLKLQNLFLLLASYLFYAWWDWRFLSILIASSVINFLLGIQIEKRTNPRQRKILLSLGLFLGIGGLVLFKYFNFFITSFNVAFSTLSININLQTLNILIPLGISYYTFKTISYLLDVDKGKIKATKDWIIFFTYVSFFPCVLSGPIDKARTFIPQLERKREFNYDLAVDGLRQVLWGLFKKVVIADNCASIANDVFTYYYQLSASTLLLGAFFYTFQMYADFSGYSDMAIGLSRMLGLNVTKNFNFPFFSQNIAEFWRRWHISLTAWLTEYVFTPLSITFRDYGKAGLILAIVINFVICGIWHGANWTYLLFGFLHGCYFIPLILRGTMNKSKKIAKGILLPSFIEVINVLTTFFVVMLTFIVFRAENIREAFHYYRRLLSRSLFTTPNLPRYGYEAALTLFFIFFLMLVEWIQREKEHGLQLEIKRPIYRWSIYTCIIFLIGMFMQTTETPFIYFNF